ncbi:MAG: hypothetical protein KA450_03990 [Bacteroidia bacterium]|nr:hypothetical protein [Bacteroidia bacterium]
MIKRCLVLVLFYCISFGIHAQSDNNVQKLKDLKYLGEILTWNGIPYTGKAIDFIGPKYDQSKLVYEGYFIQGKPNGIIRKWYSNFNMEYEENYNMGIKEGIQYYYYSNGQKREVVNYNNGLLEGMNIYFHENSKIKKQLNFKKGIQTDTLVKEFSDSGLLEKETHFDHKENVRKERIFSFEPFLIKETGYKKNRLVWQGSYSDSAIVCCTWDYFNEEGRLEKQVIYETPVDYVSKLYFLNGNKMSEYKIKNGKLDGRKTTWSESGKMSFKFYNNGIEDLYYDKIISNYQLITSESLLLYHDINGKEKIVKIVFDELFEKSNNSKSVKDKILSIIVEKMPFTKLSQDQYTNFKYDTINSIIEFRNLFINPKFEGSIRTSTGKTIPFYVCTITFGIYVSDCLGNHIANEGIIANSERKDSEDAAFISALKDGTVLERLKPGYLNFDLPRFLKKHFKFQK